MIHASLNIIHVHNTLHMYAFLEQNYMKVWKKLPQLSSLPIRHGHTEIRPFTRVTSHDHSGHSNCPRIILEPPDDQNFNVGFAGCILFLNACWHIDKIVVISRTDIWADILLLDKYCIIINVIFCFRMPTTVFPPLMEPTHPCLRFMMVMEVCYNKLMLVTSIVAC